MPGISEHSILMSLEELARKKGRVSTVLEMLVATDLRGCARGARTPYILSSKTFFMKFLLTTSWAISIARMYS